MDAHAIREAVVLRYTAGLHGLQSLVDMQGSGFCGLLIAYGRKGRRSTRTGQRQNSGHQRACFGGAVGGLVNADARRAINL